MKELPGGGAGSEPGCARTCALTVRPRWSRSYPAGAARREGTGSEGPRRGSFARRSGRERDLTGRGQRGAGGAEPRAESAAREPSGEECTRGPPMERYKGKGMGPPRDAHFLLAPRGTGKQN